MDVKPALQRPATVAVGQKNGVVRGREAPQAPHLGAVILEPRKDTASATLPDPWSGKMAHVNELLAARKVKDTVNEGERLLNERPPPSAKGQLYKVIALAQYDNGDSEAALRYFELYRQFCPESERPLLEERIDKLRADLGLAPSR